MTSKILPPRQCDSVILEFISFIDNEFNNYRAKAEEFDENQDQLDGLILVKFLLIILLIFHLLSKLFLPLDTAKHPQRNNLTIISLKKKEN